MTLVFFLRVVQQGLLASPDMAVTGNGSTPVRLQWYVDRLVGDTPSAWALSAPLWLYKIAMLAWSLWLASSLVRWLSWAWRSFESGGIWKPLRVRERFAMRFRSKLQKPGSVPESGADVETPPPGSS